MKSFGKTALPWLLAIVAAVACGGDVSTEPLTSLEAYGTATAEARAGARSEVALVVPWFTGVTSKVLRMRITTTRPTRIELFDGTVDGFSDPDEIGFLDAPGVPVTTLGSATHEATEVERMIRSYDPDGLVLDLPLQLTLYDRPGFECVILRPVSDGIGISVEFEWIESTWPEPSR